ncbi:TonB-dependent receptor [Pseudomonas sp. 148P]|uniref:TonB-dependent receptor n=1 Tax=Pseudomonas ulcerans TaxID=3115852 RepID=A0ABU7HZY0_9PSED|nr:MULTISPECIES: TonB-dependent receptor [unclassified Pseudomonas]MEE1921800.1 TonB-dependent receptor [Pseudomonas sp. 147P]MEE1937099.1 TonB-dependent receptor [Pseudomonas sp. 148P]
MFQVFCPVPKGRGGWSLRLKRAACGGLLGLACLNGGVLPALADEAAAQLPSQVHAFDIPAQRLSSALIAFGQQSGLQVTVDAQWLRDQQSNPVHGQLSSEGALSRLLQGSGITWDYNDGVLSFRLLADADAGKLELHDTLVLGGTEENSYQGATVINHKAVQAFPGANGDITRLLQMHPAVQFSSSQQNSNTPGEIDPADISINGAKFWQNNFMIDGISINNDLDPGAHGFGEARQFDAAPSRSYGIALDADLLEEVKVYDSNVPAEYGGFNGGVIDSITRRPTKDFHGKISYSLSRSEWTKYHITGADQANFDNASNEQYTPDFEKTTLRGTLEGHLNDDFGAIFSFSQRRSTMPMNLYADGYTSPYNDGDKEQTRQLDNYMLKTYWTVNDRLSLDLTLLSAPQENRLFRENYLNSGFTNINGGKQGALKATWEGDSARWTHTLAYNDLYSSRTGNASDTIAWYYSQAKNWGKLENGNSRSGEGSFGNLDQTQKSIDYDLKVDWQSFQFAGATHSLTTGVELRRTDATWERESTGQGVSAFKRDTIATCANDDPWCSISLLADGNTRQWANQRTAYGAGKLEVEEIAWAVFAQDAMQIGKLGLRPGVRFEGDDYMDQKTVSPRFAGDYDFFGDRSTVLVFGANRYYGRNLFKYRLNDGRQAFNTFYTRTSQTAEWKGTTNQNLTRFAGLDIPYDDEWTLGLEQRWLDTDFSLKYVHRSGHDKIVKANRRVLAQDPLEGYQSLYTQYTNEGSSESDNVSLTITPLQPIRFLGSYTSLQVALDWSHSKDAYGSYESSISLDELNDSDVIYDGERMSFTELPPNDYNRPWTARLSTITEIPAWNLTISNFVRYRGAYDQIIDTGRTEDVDGEALAIYDAASVKAAPTWDMRVKWEIPTARDQALFVAVDVTNVTDEVNEIVYSGSTAKTTYEIGRQYWLEVGYRF